MNPRPRPPAGQAAAASSEPGAVPGDVRDQIRRLQHDGGTYRAIAAAAGLAPATVHDLASGRRQPTPATTRALSKVTSGTLRRARLDAGGSRLRLRALHVMGHGSARIARALGVREMTIRAIVRGDTATVSARLRDADHRPVRRLVGQARPRTHPLRARRRHRRPPPGHRRQLVRRRRPGRRRTRHPRLPPRQQLETRHRHRHRPRHPPARTTPEGPSAHDTDNQRRQHQQRPQPRTPPGTRPDRARLGSVLAARPAPGPQHRHHRHDPRRHRRPSMTSTTGTGCGRSSRAGPPNSA